VDELLEAAEERLQGHRQQFAEKVMQGMSEPALGDLHMFLADPETGLFNRSYMGLKFDEEFKRARRFNSPLSVVLVDMPTTSASARAMATQRVAGLLLNECRDIDAPGRIETNVFMLLLPGTAADGCRILTGRLAASFEDLVRELGLQSAPAVGYVTYPAPDIQHRDDLLHRARRALEAAKSSPTGSRVRGE
jgi:diguanylate cyclase (GGDEF)-like protein